MAKTSGTVYVVAMPIGNVKDISERALMILESVQLILSEDTRTTRKFFAMFPHRKFFGQLLRLDEHVQGIRLGNIVDQIAQGADAAIVSEAGTPGISDPGVALMAECRERGITIVPIPGPSALATILSVADFHTQPVAFYGFLPKKKGRETTLHGMREMQGTKYGPASAVLYESPERIQRTLADLAAALGPDTHLVVGRELTKQHEELWYGTLAEALAYFAKPRGEFTLLVQLSAERTPRLAPIIG
ncbi:16S rRNA (cytidine(1402)-2'-O)-methyltransferase [Candidatus Berkelbacteria bacterium]|nr:16S rRNA (cytidine(1402)-2'-O)-methyltransferase [Candidatus Berkelbacteria bacterium]